MEKENYGKLLKGQKIEFLENSYPRFMDGKAGTFFSTFVEVRILDINDNGYVNESNITYNRPKHNLWCKNIVLTRDYYYTGTVEDIWEKDWWSIMDWGEMLNDGIKGTEEGEKAFSIRWMWQTFFQHTMLISENFIVLMSLDNHIEYKIISVKKKGNNYTLNLLDLDYDDKPKVEFEITLLDNGDSIVITNIVQTKECYGQNAMKSLLNIKYIPYDKEKAKTVENKVDLWIRNQYPEWEKYIYGY